MRLQKLLYIFLFIIMCLLLVKGQRPDFLNLRRKYHYRYHCLHRRCMPLHSRVPFP